MKRTTFQERHLGVEKLEDRRLLAVIADAIAPAGLQAEIRVLDPGGVPIGLGTGALGDGVVVQTVPIPILGTYTVEVSGSAGTLGNYELELLLNAAKEDESTGGPTNDTFGTAQDIDSSFLSLGFGTAERGAVVGALASSIESEDFESGSLGGQWSTFSSHSAGRIQVTDSFGAAAGSFALLMDTTISLTPTLNKAIWRVDLSGVTNPVLSFSHADFFDEETALPSNFIGFRNGDGVAISDDGLNWHTVTNATNIPSGTWESVEIDLAAEAAASGMTLGTNFRIKFQQFDNSPLPGDGRGYDEIRITVPDVSSPEDWYRFGLADGQSATLGLTTLNESNPLVDLYSADGTTLLASGTAGEITQIIRNFVDDTTDGTTTYYFARVSGLDGQYSLVVTRDADFDADSDADGNDVLESAADITLTGTVLGSAVASGAPVITAEVEPNDDGVPGGSLSDLPLANDWSSSFLPVGGNQFAATLTGSISAGSVDYLQEDIPQETATDTDMELALVAAIDDGFAWL